MTLLNFNVTKILQSKIIHTDNIDYCYIKFIFFQKGF